MLPGLLPRADLSAGTELHDTGVRDDTPFPEFLVKAFRLPVIPNEVAAVGTGEGFRFGDRVLGHEKLGLTALVPVERASRVHELRVPSPPGSVPTGCFTSAVIPWF